MHLERFIPTRCFGGLLLLAILLPGLASNPGCSPDVPLSAEYTDAARAVPCGETTYANFAARFFHDYCLPCHNEMLTTDLERTDAPTGINFNTLDGIRAFQRRIRLRAGEQGDMPPTLLPLARPTEEKRAQLMRWIDCGTPQ